MQGKRVEFDVNRASRTKPYKDNAKIGYTRVLPPLKRGREGIRASQNTVKFLQC